MTNPAGKEEGGRFFSVEPTAPGRERNMNRGEKKLDSVAKAGGGKKTKSKWKKAATRSTSVERERVVK